MALFCAACAGLCAQSQPFLPPPALKEASKPGAARSLVATAPQQNCEPAGDIGHGGNIVTVNLTVRENVNEINNPAHAYKDKVKLRSYGGCLTGPLIEAHPGNTLRVHLNNQLDTSKPSCNGETPGCFNTINLHFHGLHVSPSGNSDNVLLNIAPSTRFEYEVNIPEDHPSGTFWYHAHRHGSTAVQVASGASGVLIVRGNRMYTGGALGDVDTILRDAAGKPLKEQVFLFQQIPYACFSDWPGTYPPTKIMTNADGTWACPPPGGEAAAPAVVESFDLQVGVRPIPGTTADGSPVSTARCSRR